MKTFISKHLSPNKEKKALSDEIAAMPCGVSSSRNKNNSPNKWFAFMINLLVGINGTNVKWH